MKIAIITVNYNGRFPLTQLDAFFNDTYLGTVKQSPFQLVFKPEDSDNLTSQSKLKVVVRDSVGDRAEASTDINIAN